MALIEELKMNACTFTPLFLVNTNALRVVEEPAPSASGRGWLSCLRFWGLVARSQFDRFIYTHTAFLVTFVAAQMETRK